MSKKHHFVPIGLLKHFASTEKRKTIFIFDKLKRTAYGSSLKDAGCENYFNAIDLGDTRLNFEDAFQECDAELGAICKRLVAERTLERLAPSDRVSLAYLAAIQFARVKRMREVHAGIAQAIRHAATKFGASMPHDLAGDTDSHDGNDAKLASLRMLGDAAEIAKHFVDKDWALLLAPPQHPFWISDNQIAIRNQAPHGENGLGSDGVEITWPIGSEVLLAFRSRTIANTLALRSSTMAAHLRSSPTEHCTPENVRYYNSQQVYASSRFVYGPTKEFGLAREMVAAMPELASSKSSAGRMKVGWNTEKNARIPPGKWLVLVGPKAFHMIELLSARESASGFEVVIAESGMKALPAAMEDLPAKQAVLYEDQMPRTMIGGATLAQSNAQNVVEVMPDDVGLRRVFSKRNASDANRESN